MRFENVSGNKGFTLVELLVVIAIISLLSSVIIASINVVNAKGRDAKRISDLRSIQVALELYYDTNGMYPHVTSTYSPDEQDGCEAEGLNSPEDRWCGALATALAPYISPIPTMPGIFRYRFDSDTGDNRQTYGLAVRLESNVAIAENDGGYYLDHFEVGQQPVYCMQKYIGSDADWWDWSSGNPVCLGGN